ncbi:MAG: urea carboxylase [Phycisphaerales bacterium]|nr:urea carboxylase [Phycisphaerales bacterium]
MFSKVLVANRGEIACRVIRTLKRMGIASVAVYSDADLHAMHVAQADESVRLGPPPAAQSYLNVEAILAAANATGAQAIHPGYGFLSENAEFADRCAKAGIVFIGPTGEQMRRFGLKHTAREIALQQGVPLLPGTDLLADAADARHQAEKIGYPVMLKSTAGGGGIGMRLCQQTDELAEAYASVERLSQSNFKQSGIYLEKFLRMARHIEVQIFGDSSGNVVALGERDCSIQRRNQKVIEETPAPGISDELRRQLLAAAVKLACAAGYQSAGTVEFIVDAASGSFYFLEVNTRLQVEHPITEQVTGLDLVEWMLQAAAGELNLGGYQTPQPQGCSIEVRIYAEDPARNFQPSAGRLDCVAFPSDARIESWVESGTSISTFYDPLLAKLIVTGHNRADATAKLSTALEHTTIAGVESNLEYLRQIVRDPGYAVGTLSTRFLSTFEYGPNTIDVLEPGPHTTLQDYPGRIGYWDVGVPPSGPMDDLSFRLANRILGNPTDAAGLEFTVAGATLRFNADTTIALTGATMRVRLDEQAISYYRPVAVKRGQVLHLGRIAGPGFRTYLAVKHGLDVPPYLGSRSTFTLGNFGGHAGRQLRAGDVLHLRRATGPATTAMADLPAELAPPLSHHWQIGVLYGPHGAPDFFTPEDIAMLFNTDWKVHYNSNRTGVRLIGPKPTWARRDGGEAGLHPSNIHDNAYAIGTIDFTGDMPVILGPDGPSLGGFVCPATIVQAELWKIGQLKPGDTVRFCPLTRAEARALLNTQDSLLHSLGPPSAESSAPAVIAPSPSNAREDAILAKLEPTTERAAVVYRQSGDAYLLVEYGPLALDINLRLRVQSLLQYVLNHRPAGIIDLTPGIRSLQFHVDQHRLALPALVDWLIAAEAQLPDMEHAEVPSRIVHLPLSWDDPATQLAIQKYMQGVRPDAPWCPSNIDFIRRINGLASISDVKRIVFDASYLVLGLGDVYLGAPVATPLDPRHRLVTTKYNPARTWTPENAVGIGGAYLCVYGMEGPGGYQFVGRTVQMWNTFRQTGDFIEGKPWLLRFFDQIKFYPVSAEELLRMRDDFSQGKFSLETQPGVFKMRDYNRFLYDNADSIGEFKSRQQAAFEAERERWKAAGLLNPPAAEESVGADTIGPIDESATPVRAELSGSVWKIHATRGQSVKSGEPLVTIESMKMEIAVLSPVAGTVRDILCAQGKPVASGQALVLIDEP